MKVKCPSAPGTGESGAVQAPYEKPQVPGRVARLRKVHRRRDLFAVLATSRRCRRGHGRFRQNRAPPFQPATVHARSRRSAGGRPSRSVPSRTMCWRAATARLLHSSGMSKKPPVLRRRVLRNGTVICSAIRNTRRVKGGDSTALRSRAGGVARLDCSRRELIVQRTGASSPVSASASLAWQSESAPIAYWQSGVHSSPFALIRRLRRREKRRQRKPVVTCGDLGAVSKVARCSAPKSPGVALELAVSRRRSAPGGSKSSLARAELLSPGYPGDVEEVSNWRSGFPASDSPSRRCDRLTIRQKPEVSGGRRQKADWSMMNRPGQRLSVARLFYRTTGAGSPYVSIICHAVGARQYRNNAAVMA